MFSNKKQPQIKVSPRLVVNNGTNTVREILKEATALKKEKKYDDACEKLKKAFASEGAEDLMIKERLRLPMYLQLAKKNDEGWRTLNELNIKYTDVFSQAEIANQMRVFLQKEKKHTQAIIASAWSICKEIERDKYNIKEIIKLSDKSASNKNGFDFLGDNTTKTAYGKTPKGNPITDRFYKICADRIIDSVSADGVGHRILPLLKKAKKVELLGSLSNSISEYLKSSKVYNFGEIGAIINEILIGKETDE